MQRVIIIGPCGSGKSTLARELAKRLGLPVFHMDKLNWRPGWVETPKPELLERVQAVTAGERWLIDGNYGGTLGPRLARADTVIYLDFPITLCLWRVVKRVLTHRGQTRPDMADGCPERFDLGFMLYLAGWHWGPRLRTEAVLREHEAKVIRLPGPRALKRWLGRIETRLPCRPG
jgi:adenylate kinase family enzyme